MSTNVFSERFVWARRSRRRDYLLGLGAFFLIALVGLYIVKWSPYVNRAVAVAVSHSMGASIISGSRDLATAPEPSVEAALGYAASYFAAVWQAMLLGMLLAATIETLVPHDWLTRVLGSRSFRSSALGGMFALPTMMWTCCSAPVVTGLARSGASIGSVVAFFLGNPTLNPAVLVFLVLTLGWPWALLRLALGVSLVFGSAFLASRLSPGGQGATTAARPSGDYDSLPLPGGAWYVRWIRSFGRLAVWLLPEYIVLVGALGAARAFLFPVISPGFGNDPFVTVGFAIAGMLFVIPTAGEIPIIQTLRLSGIGAGPAGALLLTLAPISLPSLVMVARVLPIRVLFLLAGATVIAGICGGVLAVVLGL